MESEKHSVRDPRLEGKKGLSHLMKRLASIGAYSILLLLPIAFIKPNVAEGQPIPLLVREGSASAEAIGPQVAIATIREGRVATAVRDSNGNLKLIAWQVSGNSQGTSPGGKFIVRKGQFTSGPIKEVAIHHLATDQLVTAVRSGNDELLVATWQVSPDAQTIQFRGQVSAGVVSNTPDCLDIDFVRGEQWLTTFRALDGTLKLNTW